MNICPVPTGKHTAVEEHNKYPLWGKYVNGTLTYIVNKYTVSIIENERIKAIFEDAMQRLKNKKHKL